MSGPIIRRLYYSASEVAELAQIKPYLLASWETQFPQLKSVSRGGRRFFTPGDLELILKIKALKDQGFVNEKIKHMLAGAKIPAAEETVKEKTASQPGESIPVSSPCIAEILRELREIHQMLS